PVGATPWSPAAEVAATVAAAKASPAEHDALASTSDRTPLAAADPQVHLQLEGVHPLLPWTSAISLHVRGRDTDGPHEFETTVTVRASSGDAHLPGWIRACDGFELKLAAADPWYEAVDRAVTELRAAEWLMHVPVHPATVLLGRVVNELR